MPRGTHRFPIGRGRQHLVTLHVEERVGVEPTRELPLPIFETGAFDHSATSPMLIYLGDRRGSNPRLPAPQASALPTELRPP